MHGETLKYLYTIFKFTAWSSSDQNCSWTRYISLVWHAYNYVKWRK